MTKILFIYVIGMLSYSIGYYSSSNIPYYSDYKIKIINKDSLFLYNVKTKQLMKIKKEKLNNNIK